MTQAAFIRHKGNLEGVELIGHVDSGEYGFDTARAAVSTLSINLINLPEALADRNADLAANKIDGGYMKIDISYTVKKTGEKTQLLLKSFLLGMTNSAENSQGFVSVQVIAN